MRNILFLLPICISLPALALEVTIIPNTNLFEDYGCHKFEGNEAVRAALQLIASARLNITISSGSFENKAVRKLLKNKSNSVETKLFSSNPINIDSGIYTYKVAAIAKENTFIKVDYSFIGMGDIEFSEPMQVRSSFLVCRSPEANKYITTYETRLNTGTKYGY